MRTVKISDLITASIDRTKTILFRPFQLRKWLTLLLIAALAGALSTGGRANFSNPAEKSDSKASSEQTQNKDTNKATASGNLSQSHSTSQTTSAKSKLSMGILILLVALGLILGLFFIWLSSRFEFIWLNAVIRNVSQIREPWKVYQPQGQSLFRTRLATAGGSLIYLAVIGVWGFMALRSAGAFEKGYVWSVSGTLSMLAPLLLVVIPISIVAGFLLGFIGDFAAPLMLRDQINFIPSWQKFWPLFRANVGDFVIFALIHFLLRILTALLEVLGIVIVILALILAAVIIFGPLYLIFVVLLKVKMLMLASLVILGIPFFLAALLMLFSVRLPFAIFFRCFSLFFLSSHGEDYRVISN